VKEKPLPSWWPTDGPRKEWTERWWPLALGLLFLCAIFFAVVSVGPRPFRLDRESLLLVSSYGVPGLTLIAGGIGYAKRREWGRLVVDVGIWTLIARFSLSVGAGLAHFPRPSQDVEWLAPPYLIVVLPGLPLLFCVWARMHYWRPAVLARFGTEAKADPRLRLSLFLRMTAFIAALIALSYFRAVASDQAHVEWLHREVHSSKPEARARAILALAEYTSRRGPELEPAMCALQTDASPEVRSAAAVALGSARPSMKRWRSMRGWSRR